MIILSKSKDKKAVVTQRSVPSRNPKVLGVQEWYNPQTGETVDAVTTMQQTSDINFTKVWISNLLFSLEVVGGAKMKVVNYILDNLNYSENMLVATHKEISDKIGISSRTVGETIRLLRDANFLTTRPGVIMVNPDVLAKGSNGKRNALLIRFNNFNNFNDEDKAGDEVEN